MGKRFYIQYPNNFRQPRGPVQPHGGFIKGRRKEIFDSPVIGMRLCSDEILYDRGGNTFEGSCDCISATAGWLESPDSASSVTFPWAKGASIPRRSAEPFGSELKAELLTSKPADPERVILEALERRGKGFPLKQHCDHRKTSFSDDLMEFT